MRSEAEPKEAADPRRSKSGKQVKFYSRVYKITVVSIIVAVLSGCGGPKGPPDMPMLQPCSIVVTMDGKALEGASVHCQPPEDGQWYGSGVTDSGGVAQIKTLSRYPGLAEGDYAVSVMKTIPDPNWTPTPDKGPSPVHVADVRYADAATSPLKCTVKTGKNQFKFDVESAKPH